MASGTSESAEGGLYAVVPKTNCPHGKMVQPVPGGALNTKAPCATCSDTKENWVCLVCYEVHCSRYVNNHMVDHAKSKNHPVTLSFSDLSVWCYECDDYVTDETFQDAKKAAHKDKFGEDLS